MRIALYSLFTLGLLFGMLFSLIFAIGFTQGMISAPVLITGTIIVNLLIWLFGPFVMEITQKWLYKTRQVGLDELGELSPASRQIIEQVCQKYSFKLPRIWLIDDFNPTAYTYGSGRYNARLVLSKGIFHYLEESEVAAVVAHELGHIKRYDFIVMSMASTLVQLMYQVYIICRRRGGRGGKKDPRAAIAFAAFIFHYVGQYVLLFLSRVREYGADEFAARETGNPNALSTALIKIAYGINQQVGKGDKSLAENAGALNIFDHKAAKGLGNVYSGAQEEDDDFVLPSLPDLQKVILFDKVSYWAWLLEFQSTHPLTGKRIAHLNQLCVELGQPAFIDLTALDSTAQEVDQGRLRKDFMIDVIMLYLGWILLFAGVISGALMQNSRLFVIGVIGFFTAKIFLIIYRYPSLSDPKHTTIMSAMQDLYVSPVRGTPIRFEGKVIGKGNAGSKFNEDIKLQDPSGQILLNYQGLVPFFSNLMMAFRKFKKLLGQQCATQGWFFRGIYQYVDVDRLMPENSEMKVIKSYPVFWQSCSLGLMNIGLIVILFTQNHQFERINLDIWGSETETSESVIFDDLDSFVEAEETALVSE